MNVLQANLLGVLNKISSAKTEGEREDLIRIARTVFTNTTKGLRPAPLVWRVDDADPDVQNASDVVLGKVWQIESFDDSFIIRAYNKSRDLTWKMKIDSPDASPLIGENKVEELRSLMFDDYKTDENSAYYYAPEPAETPKFNDADEVISLD